MDDPAVFRSARDARLQRETVAHRVGVALLVAWLLLPDFLADRWGWTTDPATAWPPHAVDLARSFFFAARSLDPFARWASCAPLLALPLWLVAGRARAMPEGSRRTLRAVLVGAAVLLAASAVGRTARDGYDWWVGGYALYPTIEWEIAVTALFALTLLLPPRRKVRRDPRPWAAALAAALLIPRWEATVLDVAGLPGGIAINGPRGGIAPGQILVTVALLLLAVPAYLPRRRRAVAGAPVLREGG
jgi:hypothetical protein